jgi:hypothetical protein
VPSWIVCGRSSGGQDVTLFFAKLQVNGFGITAAQREIVKTLIWIKAAWQDPG